MSESRPEKRTLVGAHAALFRELLGVFTDGILAEKELDVPLDLGCGPFDALTPEQKLWCTLEVSKCLLVEDEVDLPNTAMHESTYGALMAYLKVMIELELVHQSEEMDAKSVVSTFRELVVAAAEQVESETNFPSPECVLFDEWELVVDRLQYEVIPDEDWMAESMHLDGDPEEIRKLRKNLGIDDEYFVHVAPDSDDIDVSETCRQLRKLAGN